MGKNVGFQEKQADILSEKEINFVNTSSDGARMRKMQKRAGRCICKYCGNELALRKITYAAYDEAKIEVYCDNCGRIEYGTEPLIYKMAEYYIDEIKFDYYPQLDESENKRRMNIALISEIIGWGFKNAGLINEDGFNVDLSVDAEVVGEVSIFAADELREGE